MTFEKRWGEITDIWKNILPDADELNTILRGLAAFGALSLVGLFFFGGETPIFRNSNTLGYWTNIVTELLGVAFTVFVLNELAKRRETKTKQAELLNQVGSRSNDITIGALEQLRHEGWLTGEDGLLAIKGFHNAKWEGADLFRANLSGSYLERANLSRADLERANLSGADLEDANLSDANLEDANLSDANLWAANLSDANLWAANLSDANLVYANLSDANLVYANLSDANLLAANLSGADLREAKLSDANLVEANLSGASLVGANLSGADLSNATFDEQTRLPDYKKWTPETDMTRYTNPEHPAFWQPDWVATGFDSVVAWYVAGRPAPEPGDEAGSAD